MRRLDLDAAKAKARGAKPEKLPAVSRWVSGRNGQEDKGLTCVCVCVFGIAG